MMRIRVLCGIALSRREKTRGPSRVAHLKGDKVSVPTRIASAAIFHFSFGLDRELATEWPDN
jgi:hypothetical protein